MTARHATRDALLAYLADERCMARIVAYMHTMHKVQPGAVREQLRRLVQAGLIERLRPGCYQRVSQ